MVGENLKEGSLIRLLTDYELKNNSTPIHALFAHRTHIPAKTRVFTEFLKDKLSTEPWSQYE